jgi:3',5'-cyclic AMP phosphodiesterase CpdA
LLGTINLIINRAREFDQGKDLLLIEKIRELKIEDIIITGDLTSTSLDEEYKRAVNFMLSLSNNGHSVFVLPGNHDRYTFESAQDMRFEKYMRDWRIKTGTQIQSKDRGDYFLILLDQTKPNFISSRGLTSEKTLDELRTVLNTIKDQEKPVIIGGHYPLITSTPHYSRAWHREMKNAWRLRQTVGQSGKTIFYLCGHVHKYYCLQDPLYTNVMYISCGAPFSRKNKNEMLKFNEIHINEGKCHIISHYLSSEWQKENVFCEEMR